VPVVIAYQIWIYRIFRQSLKPDDIVNNKESY